MSIREPGGKLLARVERKKKHVYVLDVNIARRATCLATHAKVDAQR